MKDLITGLIKPFIKSSLQIGHIVLLGHRPDVIFYYPALFNRSERGTNPFFEPLKSTCEDRGLTYLMIEESAGEKYPTDIRSIKGDSLFWLIWVVRKIVMTIFKRTQLDADKYSAKIIDLLTFHKFRAKTYITISNSMIDVLGEIYPSGNVYDLQHGIIYNGHTGYFKNKNELRPTFQLPNRRVLLWGNLYLNNLNDLEGDFDKDNKFLVIGYPMYKEIKINSFAKDKVILVSMQFTADVSPEISGGMLEMLEEFIEEATKKGYEILLKHHPRFAGEVDLNPLLYKYIDNVKLTNKSLEELAEIIKLQMTWGSTTAFEYAAYGVPTYFLRDSRFDWATDIFYGQYQYPLYDKLSYTEVLKRIENVNQYKKDCDEIKKWYESAYSPLDIELTGKILSGDQYEK